jgi:Rieske Fe-S protein
MEENRIAGHRRPHFYLTKINCLPVKFVPASQQRIFSINIICMSIKRNFIMNISRKEFFRKSAQGLAVVAIPTVLSSLIDSCSNNPTSPSTTYGDMPVVTGTLVNGKVTVNVDSSSPLASVGAFVVVNYSSDSVMVDHPSDGVYNAFSRICTHQGCIISQYDKSAAEFVCNCHGSRFNASGGVDQGPANRPLVKYSSSFANNVLTINVG